MTIKRLLFLCVLFVGLYSYGQNPTNYLLRQTRERIISSMVDSMFRIPRYNGTPSGVRVGETSAIDGAIAMDTTNHRMYIFSGNAWVRLAKYSEVGVSSDSTLQQVVDNDRSLVNNYIRFGLSRDSTNDIINDNFNRYGIGSNYDTAFPVVTRTYNGSYLEVNNAPGNFLNYMTYNKPTGRNRWKMSLKIVPVDLGAATYGVGLGLLSANSFFDADISFHFLMDNSATKGKIRVYSPSNSTVTTSSTGLAFSTGDTLFAMVERIDTLFRCTFYNQTTKLSLVFDYSISQATVSTPTTPNTGKPIIYFFGGNQKIFNYTFSSNETKNNVLFIGNSITAGYTASTLANRYVSRVFPGRYSYEISGGPGDRSADVVLKLDEIKNLRPKYALINIGVNDASNSVTTSTYSTNIRRILDTLVNNSITPILISSCPNNSYNLTTFNDTLSAIATRYGIKYVNTFDTLRSGTSWNGTYASDGIHPSDSGHAVIARIITRNCPEILGDTAIRFNRPVYNPNIRYYAGLNELTGNIEFNTVSSSSSSSSGVSGSGTATYIPKFTGSTTLGNSLIYDNGTNVGINQTSPANYSGFTSLTLNNASLGGLIQLQSNGTNALYISSTVATYGSYINELRNEPLHIYTNNTERLRIEGGGHTKMISARFEHSKGANVASAGDLTLGSDGNLFHITGTTTINAITVTNWQSGSEITLIFDGSVTVKNNTAGGGSTAVMLLAGGADFSATANDVLRLVYDGTSWFEVSRSVN